MSTPASRGLIQIYTGNGKGKTTAALGLALRARAAGKRVAIIFFDKGGEHYSERKILGELGVDWFAYGLDRIDPTTQRFRFGVIPEDVAQAEEGIAKAQELLLPVGGGVRGGDAVHPRYELLILDEINTTVALGMLDERTVGQLLDAKPVSTELVLTGRIEVSKAARPLRCNGTCVERTGVQTQKTTAAGKWVGVGRTRSPTTSGPHEHRPSYFDRADLLTEMRLEKHYFYRGEPARQGIDF